MLAKIIPNTIDIEGTPTQRPGKRHSFHPTFPLAAYMTQPLLVKCRSLEEMQAFLRSCRYVSDKKEFGQDDYWAPPEEFEIRKRGDCDCAALWAWRQLADMGYEARFVVGRAGAFGGAHAWVFVKLDREWHALEPFGAWVGMELPQLYTLWYRPILSVAWEQGRARYYNHKDRKCDVRFTTFATLVLKSLMFKAGFIPRILTIRVRRMLKR